MRSTAIRDHEQVRRDLYLFERSQYEGGLWRFFGPMRVKDSRGRQRPDQDGRDRQTIIFDLEPIGSLHQETQPCLPAELADLDLEALREAASDAETGSQSKKFRAGRAYTYERFAIVRAYVLKRA